MTRPVGFVARLEQLEQDLELVSRSVALQGAHAAVLQRIIVRAVVELALAGRGPGAVRALQDGARQLGVEAERLARAEGDYRDVLHGLLERFDRLREDLATTLPDDDMGAGVTRPPTPDDPKSKSDNV